MHFCFQHVPGFRHWKNYSAHQTQEEHLESKLFFLSYSFIFFISFYLFIYLFCWHSLKNIIFKMCQKAKKSWFRSIYLIMAQLAGAIETLTTSLQRGKTHPNVYPGYETKQSDGEAPVMLASTFVRAHPLVRTQSNKGRFEAVRPPISAGPPSGGRVAS